MATPAPSIARILLDNAEEIVAIACLLGIGAVMALQLVLRGVFDNPLGWPEVVSQFLLVWASLLGAVGAAKRSALVQVDVVVRALPVPARRIVEIVGLVAIAVLLVVLGRYGFRLTSRVRTIASPLPITWAWCYAAAPVFVVLMALRLVQTKLFRHSFVFLEELWESPAATVQLPGGTGAAR
ncbi:TRAP transporter small permease [Acuticoccus kandeliae]|uniref:TRAP transporter small permease n=1 Tax=Acuticoccus kandeliae TaxID=2073160 RepID=UPI000D3E45C9|nr:TRAP transporter small permease [Acuticoccus kandeliae]